MHLLPPDSRSLDSDIAAEDLGQTPADLVVLSFSDGDLAGLAAAHAGDSALPSLRLANLNRLKHPFSVDLYVEKVAARARVVLVRLLGGLDYWRYGTEELAAAARRRGFALAVVPGCERADARLDAASTLPDTDLRRLWAWFREGGPDNLAQVLRFAGARGGYDLSWSEPRPLPAAALHRPFCRKGAGTGHALIVFYRSALLVADTAPVETLADALHARGLRVSAFAITSLKDAAAAEVLAAHLDTDPPDLILNATAFSARLPDGGTVLDRADVPVLQVVQAGIRREAWDASTRGLGAADLAMNVVLPETDGRILAGVLSFKAEGERRAALEFAPLAHRPEPDRIAHVADLAQAWVTLRRTPRGDRRLACVLSDYPGKAGRGGYAVGLDTPASLNAIAARLAAEGFDIGAPPADVMATLTAGAPEPVLSLADYERALAALPAAFVASVRDAWGEPEDDPAVREGAFAFRIVRSGKLVVAIQPDRGRRAERRADYHDSALPPRHAYVAFYVWLRETERIHALVHLGTHGTLEWLPGKALALGRGCAPEAVLGPVPLIYPFIVNNPGEAAQAKRRSAAVTIGHLTPPLVEAGTHGVTADLEALFDEYAEAEGLDARRARLLAAAILDRARETGLAADCGLGADEAPGDALLRLDAWLCDLKEARIGDGLHVFGSDPSSGTRSQVYAGCVDLPATRHLLPQAGEGSSEMRGLLAALDGRFVPPGPSGSPSRGRADVLPTGRNLYAVDPRAVPTRTAYEIGCRAAAEFMTRYAQDHGDWPRSLVLDLWGSATMRTGGDDLAQAFALIGARPCWEDSSTRVIGYEVLPSVRLERPRVDVTLRISGLFRDTFPEQIALFDAAARAVANLGETDEDNPLAEARRAGGDMPFHRVFGAAPNAYGAGVADALNTGAWDRADDLGERYLAATSHAYAGPAAEPQAAGAAFRARVGAADAYLHMADLPEADILASDVNAEHAGGFAAAAAGLGNAPALYHGDATRADVTRVRSLGEEVARVMRARASNPRWIAGQMRHGHRGAAEIAETVDSLFGFAAMTDVVPSRHFDLLFDATLGDETVRAFLEASNPQAARAIAARFAEAKARGFWVSCRNSSAAILADLQSATDLQSVTDGVPS